MAKVTKVGWVSVKWGMALYIIILYVIIHSYVFTC